MMNKETPTPIDTFTEFSQREDPLAWFEVIYAQAKMGKGTVPWTKQRPNPHFSTWLTQNPLQGEGKTALVVGCGLGDDAEALAELGFGVTAFDIAPTAIQWCQERFPDKKVAYAVADLFNAPPDWFCQFDFVLEIHILQALPAQLRAEAARSMARFVAPEGHLLIICRGREVDEPPEPHPPWRLTKSELAIFEQHGLRQRGFDDYWDQNVPPVRRFRVLYARVAQN